MNTNKSPELRSFLGAYFHEDWDIEADEPDGCLANFIGDDPGDEVLKKIVSQISAYLDSEGGEVEIERGLWDTLRCYYRPAGSGMTARAWLTHVGEVLSQAVKEK